VSSGPDLAKANKRRRMRIVTTRLDLPKPEIVTPLELFTEVDHADE
jgi:hypothetical protein